MKNFSKLFLILSIGILISACNRLPLGRNNSNSDTNPANGVENSQTENAGVGTYKVYNEAEFEAESDQTRVLFFHATWCPTCKMIDQQLTERAAEVPENVIVYKTDFDNEVVLKNKYLVTYQHTFIIVDKDGNALEVWNGGGMDMLLEKIAGIQS